MHNATICTGGHLKSNPTNCEPVRRLGSDVSVHPYAQNGEEANETTRSQEASALSGETSTAHNKTITVLTPVEVSQNQTNSVSGATNQGVPTYTVEVDSDEAVPPVKQVQEASTAQGVYQINDKTTKSTVEADSNKTILPVGKVPKVSTTYIPSQCEFYKNQVQGASKNDLSHGEDLPNLHNAEHEQSKRDETVTPSSNSHPKGPAPKQSVEGEDPHGGVSDKGVIELSKGVIQKDKNVSHQNSNEGVSFEGSYEPLRDTVPKLSSANREDFVGGVFKDASSNLPSEVIPEIRSSSPNSKTTGEKQAISVIALTKLGSVEQGNIKIKKSRATSSTSNHKDEAEFEKEANTLSAKSVKFTLPTPDQKTADGCGDLQDHKMIKEDDTTGPANTVFAKDENQVKAEEYQWGFTFGLKSIPHQYYKHAEERGSVLEVKDLSLCPEPHNQVQAIIMYIWFGVGSVPWIGLGKYVLAQLLFLFAGVITTHQLDVMYVLILTAIIVADPHLSHLSHTYSVWSLCTKGVPYAGTLLCMYLVPYVGALLCMYYCTIGLIMYKGPVGREVLIPRKVQNLPCRLQCEMRVNQLLELPGIPMISSFGRYKNIWLSRNWYTMPNGVTFGNYDGSVNVG